MPVESKQNRDEVVLGEGRFIRLVRRGQWEYAKRTNNGGIVVILAVTDADEIVLIEQYRPPVRARVIELPAGLSGDIPGEEDEALATAALRELEEETGYRAERLTEIGEMVPSPGLSAEVFSLYRAHGLTRVGEGGGDAAEDIQVHVVPLRSVGAWLSERRKLGVHVAAYVYSGLYHACRG